ncbi:hypothetical protein GCM10009825_29440 [Arthrobacter humicola]|uniref:Uncharacterized protein n=1 Tax=Arthrobacter humicola TaxID=409291 RepID=A0ABN2ZEZ4_9MICC
MTPAPTDSATRPMPQPISGDGPAGSTADVACSDVLPEWPAAVAGAVFEPAAFEPVEEGRGVAVFDAGAGVPAPLPACPAVPGPVPAAGTAALPALPPADGWPGTDPVMGTDPAAAPSAAGAPGAVTGVPGFCGAEGGATLADGVPDGGALVPGAVDPGLLGSGLPDSGIVGSGLLLRDGGCVGSAISSGPEDGEGLGVGDGLRVGEEPSRLSSTSPRPRVKEPWVDGGVDAAADKPVAAFEAGTPAETASTAPSAAAAAPRRRLLWRRVVVVDTLDLKITMVIEPSRNQPRGKTGGIPRNTG